MNVAGLPDLYRYAKTELVWRKLAIAIGFAAIVSACSLLVALDSERDGRWLSMAKQIYWIQGLGLLVYGTARMGASVSGERAARTWDFQRLTPMSSWQSAWGRFLGAPLLAFVVAIAAAPFGVGAALAGGFVQEWAAWQAHLLCSALLSLSFGLFASAHAENAAIRGAGWAAPVAGLVLLSTFGQIPLLWASVSNLGVLEFGGKTILFFGQPVGPVLFMSASAVAYAGWLFAFGAWRIGHDYLERRRPWAGPAFVAFLAFYFFGLRSQSSLDLHFAAFAACVPAYTSALGIPAGEDPFREWLARARTSWRTAGAPPAWILTWAAALAAGAIFAALDQAPGLLAPALMAARDLCFIQAIQLSKFKRPELVAALALALIYVASVTLAAISGGSIEYFLPAIRIGGGVAPPAIALAHAAIGALWLWASARSGGRRA